MSCDLRKRPGWPMAARNVRAVSGPTPETVTNQPHVGSSCTSSITHLISLFASLVLTAITTGATQPGSQAPVRRPLARAHAPRSPDGSASRSSTRPRAAARECRFNVAALIKHPAPGSPQRTSGLPDRDYHIRRAMTAGVHNLCEPARVAAVGLVRHRTRRRPGLASLEADGRRAGVSQSRMQPSRQRACLQPAASIVIPQAVNKATSATLRSPSVPRA